MKIIFVGLHNKPDKIPLCSSTKSGKLIDRIIKEGYFTNVQKTNLFDVDYYPTKPEEQRTLSEDWIERIDPAESDIIVLLGASVHRSFIQCVGMKTIKVAHPASKRSHKEMNEYVDWVINRIQNVQPFYP